MSNEQFAGLQRRKPSETGQYWRWLGFGDSDSGKTTALGTIAQVPELCPVLHLDLEKGSDSLGYLEDNDNITILQPQTWGKLQEIYNILYNDAEKGKVPFKSVSIDNGTIAQSLGIYKLLGVDINRKFDLPNLAEFKDFNGSTEQILRFMRAFTDLPMHFFMTAWAEQDEDPKTKQNKAFPSFVGKLKRKVPGLVSQVHYFYKEEKKDKPVVRKVLTESTPTVTAKTRRIQLPQVIEDFHMRMLVEAPLKQNVHEETK